MTHLKKLLKDYLHVKLNLCHHLQDTLFLQEVGKILSKISNRVFLLEVEVRESHVNALGKQEEIKMLKGELLAWEIMW